MPTIRIRDVSLFVRTMCSGPPIVLMHGGPGLDHTTLLGLASLARDRLLFYDHRCNGRSSGDPETMTWDNLTADTSPCSPWCCCAVNALHEGGILRRQACGP